MESDINILLNDFLEWIYLKNLENYLK